MSAEARPFTLEAFGPDRLGPVDMSDSIGEIVSFTSVGSLGEVTQAKLVVDAAHGWHVTRGRPGRGTGSGGAFESEGGPILDQFTLLRLTVGRGAQAYSRYLEVRSLRLQDTSSGLLNNVEAEGLERNLKDVLVPGHWWFMTYREVLDAIISHYNAQRGTAQPPLRLLPANVAAGLPLDRPTPGPINLYAGTDCHTAVNLIVDRLRQPVASGGSGDFVSIYFTDYVDGDGATAWSARAYPAGAEVTHNGRRYRASGAATAAQEPGAAAVWGDVSGTRLGIDMHVVSQGARGSSVPTIRARDIEGVSSDFRQRYPPASTLAVVRGTPGSGTMPMSVAHQAGGVEAFARAPPWRTGVPYAMGQVVRDRPTTGNNPDGTPQHHDTRRWRCKVSHVSSASNRPPSGTATSSAEWEAVTEWAYMQRRRGDTVGMDNWAYEARKSGGMWDLAEGDDGQSYNEGVNSVSYPDSNLVVRDQDVWADWAHYRYDGSDPLANDAADGTRVLIDGIAPSTLADGTPSGLSTTADDNALIQRIGGEWVVVRSDWPDTGTYEVNVLGEGRVYEWTVSIPTTARAVEVWDAGEDYPFGYTVRHVATAMDAAANTAVTAGTTYVWRRLSFGTSRYTRADVSTPPPRDSSRWELVGELADDNAPTGTVPPGYGPLRRRRQGTRRWVDVSRQGLTPNHCFHYPAYVRHDPPIVRVPDGGPAQLRRAVTVEYSAQFFGVGDAIELVANVTAAMLRLSVQFVGVDAINTVLRVNGLPALPGGDSTAWGIYKSLARDAQEYFSRPSAFANLGWWYTLFEAPLPMNGGNVYRPPYLDLNNRNMTPAGSSGWTAADAEEMDKLTGIRFDILFDKLLGPWRAAQGDMPFRCFLMDSESNVWVHDFVVRHLNVRQDVLLAFSSFKPYSARAPINVQNTLLNTIRPELRTLESLNRRQIKHIGLHLTSNYDENGRFVPWFNPWHTLFETSGSIFTSQPIRHVGTIDNFCFVKAPIAVARGGTGENQGASGRNVMAPVTDVPVSNTVQLRQVAEAQAALGAWRLDNFTVVVAGRPDILAEQSVVVEDPRIVSESDAAAGGPAAWASGETIGLSGSASDRMRTHGGRAWQASSRRYTTSGTPGAFGGNAVSTVPPGTGTANTINGRQFYVGSDMIAWRDTGPAGGAGTLKLAVTRVSHSWQANGGAWLTDITLYRRINRGTVA